MRMNDQVFVMTGESGTADAVASVIDPEEDAPVIEVCANSDALVRSLERSPARTVVVDIDEDPLRLLGELDAIATRFSRARFVLVASEVRNEWLLQAMQAGARHFLDKKSISSDLRGVLSRLGARGSTDTAGSLVTILAAGGGCGATTLAINLGHELGLIAAEPSLVIDLDRHFGGAAAYLGAEATYGIADVLARGDSADVQLVRSCAVKHSGSLFLLASPATIDFSNPAPLDMDAIEPAIRACKAAFRHTVVDAPRVAPDVAEVLARASHRTIIAFELNVADVRIARQILAGLEARGVARDRVLCLATRYRKRKASVSLAEASAALGDVEIAHVSNDYADVVRSINLGRTLAEIAPRCAVRREIQRLAVAVGAPAAGVTAK